MTRPELVAALRADAAEWQAKIDGVRRMLTTGEQAKIEGLISRLRLAADTLERLVP